MKKFLQIALLLLFGASLIGCSSDDDTSSSNVLTVNGAEFRLGDNTPASTFNAIKSKSNVSIWLSIAENRTDGRKISVYALHEPGSATGTYVLSNDIAETGVAIPALYDSNDGQIAGGSSESAPTGTITIKEHGGNHYVLTFNDVVLDPGTQTETTIRGTCSKTFRLTSGN